jgi:predicted transcriptional regulator
MPHRLSSRQRDIMQVLWSCKEATVAELQQQLETSSPLAYTTVATMLGRLERRGLVTHRTEGRTFIYRPTVTEDDVGRSVVGELLESVFGGSPTEMVSQLLESDYVDADELNRIKELVRRHEAAQRQAATGERRGK